MNGFDLGSMMPQSAAFHAAQDAKYNHYGGSFEAYGSDYVYEVDTWSNFSIEKLDMGPYGSYAASALVFVMLLIFGIRYICSKRKGSTHTVAPPNHVHGMKQGVAYHQSGTAPCGASKCKALKSMLVRMISVPMYACVRGCDAVCAMCCKVQAVCQHVRARIIKMGQCLEQACQ